MSKIAVFDSGLGSLSIIKAIQKKSKVEIIYFADQKNFPYGQKSKSDLMKIIENSIRKIKEEFEPDIIVIGSNTPTIMLGIEEKNIIGVKPPLREAEKFSKTKNIAILGTKAAIQSKELSKFIGDSNLNQETKIHKINGSSLIDLVESGKFLTNKFMCKKLIKESLENMLLEKNIDVITLSSTHLSFLKLMLENQFPDVTFVDPANSIANSIHKKIKNKQAKKNKLKIFCSGNVKKFEKNLRRLGIKNKVNFLSI